MPKSAVSFAQVVAVIKTLEQKGERITINRVRDELGEGSPNAISQFIKQYKEGSAAPTSEPKVTTVEVAEVAPLDPNSVVKPANADINKATEVKSASAETDRVDDTKPASEGNPKKDGGNKGRRIFKKNSQQNGKRERDHKPRHVQEAPMVEEERHEFMSVDRLEQMTQRELLQQVRRLESILYKEQMRRESAVKMAQEAKQYADAIKDQVARRVQDVQQAMQATVQQLQLEIKTAKNQAQEDLKFYREQLQKANNKLLAHQK